MEPKGKKVNTIQGESDLVKMSDSNGGIRRSTTVTRTYSLGDYKNIKFSDTISSIPEHLAINHEFMGVLRFLQMVSIERSYFDYVAEASDWHNLNIEVVIENLDGFEKETMRTLKEFLNGKSNLD